MSNLARGVCLTLRDALAPHVTPPVYIDRRDEKVGLPFVVVAVEDVEPLNTGIDIALLKIQVVLATSAYNGVAAHEGAVLEIQSVLVALQTEHGLEGNGVHINGLHVDRAARTSTGNDGKSQTRGDIWYLSVGAGLTDEQGAFEWDLAPPGGSMDVLGTAVAGAALSGGRFVSVISGTASYADGPGGVPAIGFTKGAVAFNESFTVYREGDLTGLTGLTPGGALYLGANGQAVHVAPLTGTIQYLGRALTATTMAVEIDQPITTS